MTKISRMNRTNVPQNSHKWNWIKRGRFKSPLPFPTLLFDLICVVENAATAAAAARISLQWAGWMPSPLTSPFPLYTRTESLLKNINIAIIHKYCIYIPVSAASEYQLRCAEPLLIIVFPIYSSSVLFPPTRSIRRLTVATVIAN